MGSLETDAEHQKDGDAPESTDFANYFCTYAFLYHQKDMLEDRKRTGCYYDAVMKNRELFEDKVVLDVGTGSGILALFAARAGARKVSDRVVVIQGTMESVELPEKVDIIISEWMGYFLLRESMLDSVLIARNKYLKEGGSLFPSHANMYLAPIRSHGPYQKDQEYMGAMNGWRVFVNEMQQFYGVDMNCLTSDFDKEQREYYRETTQWSEVSPYQMLSQPVKFKKYDLLKVSLEEIRAPLEADLEFKIHSDGKIDALCGFFDVTFAGSPDNPARYPVTLSTAPEMGPCTHWGQLSFFLIPQIPCTRGTSVPLSLRLSRREDNHRLMNMSVDFRNPRLASSGDLHFNFVIE